MREPGYGADQTVRRLRRNRETKWQGHTIYIDEAFRAEPAGLSESADGEARVTRLEPPSPACHIAR